MLGVSWTTTLCLNENSVVGGRRARVCAMAGRDKKQRQKDVHGKNLFALDVLMEYHVLRNYQVFTINVLMRR